MQTLLHEIRYAFRTLIKSPGFAAIAILALALGIGANTAIFSIVNAVLLRPLPYPESDRLVMLREKTSTFPNGSVSYPNYLDWRAGQRSFTDLTLTRRETYNFSPMGGGAPERVGGGRVTFNFLAIMGLKPLMGRDFTEKDDVPGAAPVALISERLWKSKFGSSPSVLGKQVMVDGIAREIIGVLPDDLRFPRLAEMWVPLAETRKDEGALRRGNHPGFSVLGRLKPGVTLQQANADLDTIAAELERLYPDTNATRRVRMDLLLDSAVSDYRASLRLLLGAVACVLLIACANVANLQLARALSRGKELAVRAALGASRWQLMRQMLTESILLGIFGALAGVMLAVWSLDAILALSPARVARFQETRIDLVALFFTGGVALASGILVGLWPAWRVSKNAALSMALHEDGARGGSGGPRQQRARSALVITQVALAVVLLAGAGLTLKSFWRAQNAPINFDPTNILTVGISLPNARYEQGRKEHRLLYPASGAPAGAAGRRKRGDRRQYSVRRKFVGQHASTSPGHRKFHRARNPPRKSISFRPITSAPWECRSCAVALLVRRKSPGGRAQSLSMKRWPRNFFPARIRSAAISMTIRRWPKMRRPPPSSASWPGPEMKRPAKTTSKA